MYFLHHDTGADLAHELLAVEGRHCVGIGSDQKSSLLRVALGVGVGYVVAHHLDGPLMGAKRPEGGFQSGECPGHCSP